MIYRENIIKVEEFQEKYALEIGGYRDCYKDAIFFDLEHYVYKKPVCVGVFGCAYYDEAEKALKVTQYMIENKEDSEKILLLGKKYFEKGEDELNKKYIVTFSGNNDFTVINYLFNKFDLNYEVEKQFIHIDLQRVYEKAKNKGIGLKVLEKEFGIERDTNIISGSNLAKTFSKIMKDKEYSERMPYEKKEKILFYNEQDVVSLFDIYVNWDKVMLKEEDSSKQIEK